ncbi:MAG: energy transducer TonB [Nitrospirae bacterium]|nr:energy transducer TonB [Nitrospirota bacterium]
MPVIRKETFPGIVVAASLALHGVVGGVLVIDSGPSPSFVGGDREEVLWVEPGTELPPILPASPRRIAEANPKPRKVDSSSPVPEVPLPPPEPGEISAIPAAEPAGEPFCNSESVCPENRQKQEREAESRSASVAPLHPPGDGPAERRDKILDDFLREVREAIEKSKGYPWKARMERLEGTVTVEFSLRKNGEPELIRVARSSGYPLLDRSALEAIRNRTRFPEIPSTLGMAEMDLRVPMVYRMEER